jgi:anti-anti-sigma factor
MEIYTKDYPDKSIIVVENKKLLGPESEVIYNLLQNSIDKGIKNISIDLSNVEYISSWGIGILVRAYTTCQNKNLNFNIQGINSQVLNILDQLKLTTLFNII